jgi:hypothetical protein
MRYFAPQACTNSLFIMTADTISQAVASPQTAYLFLLGLVTLFGRRLFK